MGAIFIPIVVFCALVAASGALVAVLALRAPGATDSDLVAERLDAYRTGSLGLVVPLNLNEEEAQQSFVQRVLLPIFRRLSSALARRTSDTARIDLQRRLNMAGRPLGLSATEFVAVRYATTVMAALGGGLLGFFLGGPLFGALALGVGGVGGFMGPRYLIAGRVKKARKDIQLTLPDAMDLMSVCVEAGLTFEGAMAKVAERYDNTLGREYGLVLREIRLGRPRRDAMADLGNRCGVAEMYSFAQAIIQSETLGTGIARILRLQSDELRRRRRQRAQELGAKAGLKILFPMVLFIFPSLWIVLLGPAGLLILKDFSGG